MQVTFPPPVPNSQVTVTTVFGRIVTESPAFKLSVVAKLLSENNVVSIATACINNFIDSLIFSSPNKTTATKYRVMNINVNKRLE
jgi:hypothetical protein